MRQGGLTVGVVTPFAAQARYIRRLMEEEVPGGREALAEAESAPIVLVKGSRSAGMDQVAAALTPRAHEMAHESSADSPC